MRPKTFMLVAGEHSGDMLGAELVKALKVGVQSEDTQASADFQPLRAGLTPRFFGAGGPRMAAEGVELTFDLMPYAIVGLGGVPRHFRKFARIFLRLRKLTVERQPDAIILIDFSGFNRRFARAIKNYVRGCDRPFHNWKPKIIQYVSPQVWASREGRALQMVRDFDLILSIFPFEKAWYAKRTPSLRVEFVGHPILDRYASFAPFKQQSGEVPLIVLLPGSRTSELRRHLPLMVEAMKQIAASHAACFSIVLPDAALIGFARLYLPSDAKIQLQLGGLAEALSQATIAIAATGTVTLECAYFGVPSVTLYKTSQFTYEVAKRIIKVPFIAMPNLLAGEELFPEFVQDNATPEKIAGAALALLRDAGRREEIKNRLAKIIQSLGTPGANRRAARAILGLFDPHRLMAAETV